MLAMRKLRDPRLASFLNDPERVIRLEAARAINDIPMPALQPQLAASLARFTAHTDSTGTAEAPRMSHAFTREVWQLDRTGTAADLRSDANFVAKPTEVTELAVGAAPRNAGNKFLARISGTIEAPETGEYIFAIASDDDSILSVGTSDDRASLVELAHVDGYSEPTDFESQPNQRSKPVHLVKGQRYAIQALHA
jgi:hypothetical protein